MPLEKVLAILLFLGALVALAAVVMAFRQRIQRQLSGAQGGRILSMIHLHPGVRVCLFEANGRQYICGISKGGIQCLQPASAVADRDAT